MGLIRFESSSPTTRFVEETADLYFFANQFALLELARISDLDVPTAQRGGSSLVRADVRFSPLETLARTPLKAPAGVQPLLPRPSQVIAISDPSDMLTWPVPCMKDIKVSNLLVPMTGGPFRLFADPVRAHRGHLTNPAVWDVLLGNKPARRSTQPGWTC